MRAKPLSIGSVIVVLLGTIRAMGQQPEIVHAKLDQASASAGLSAAIASVTHLQSGPSWIGYAVPAIVEAGGRSHGGGTSCSADLEEGTSFTHSPDEGDKPSNRRMLVFLGINRQQIEKVRIFEAGCRVNAEGMPVHWLTDVRPSDSVELLSSQVWGDRGSGQEHLKGGALAAIASTDDPSADAAMEHFTSPSAPTDLRKDAVFWLGAARGRKGYEMLGTIVKQDPSDEVRDRAIFALSVSRAPEAVETLIDRARHDSNSHLRGQALFWLAQKAGARAVEAISKAAEKDPDVEVKKQAVFALTQLPTAQGVPLLIKVAQTNPSPEVRKQAFFWLGQSPDPRSLDFIASVLTN